MLRSEGACPAGGNVVAQQYVDEPQKYDGGRSASSVDPTLQNPGSQVQLTGKPIQAA